MTKEKKCIKHKLPMITGLDGKRFFPICAETRKVKSARAEFIAESKKITKARILHVKELNQIISRIEANAKQIYENAKKINENMNSIDAESSKIIAGESKQ
jgi:hypothetical protein